MNSTDSIAHPMQIASSILESSEKWTMIRTTPVSATGSSTAAASCIERDETTSPSIGFAQALRITVIPVTPTAFTTVLALDDTMDRESDACCPMMGITPRTARCMVLSNGASCPEARSPSMASIPTNAAINNRTPDAIMRLSSVKS